jgi:hypothetical protein
MMLTDKVLAEKIGLEKRCGYWECSGTYFFDKAECLRYASAYNKEVKYHLFECVFSHIDWSKEPSESLDELYKNRAQQLRDNYDYIIVSFSGGADSTITLKSFLKNGIKVDEVYSEYPIKPLEKLKDKFNGDRNNGKLLSYEWFTAAKPALENLKITHPEIKITVDDSSEASIEIVNSSALHKLFRSGCVINLSVLRYRRLYELARQREIHGRVAIVIGMDKPSIVYSPTTQTFMTVFSDFTNSFAQNSFTEFSSDPIYGDKTTVEMFYITPDMPALHQKRCFALKNYVIEMKHSGNTHQYISTLLKTHPDGTHIFDSHNDLFKKVLYSDWDNNIWQAKKDKNFFYQPSMEWFFSSDLTTPTSKDFFDKQLLEMLYGINNRFLEFENNKPASFRHLMSKPIKF